MIIDLLNLQIPWYEKVELNTLWRDYLMKKHSGICHYCHKPLTYKTATIEHIVPWSKGGRYTEENLVLSCGKCNNRKSDHIVWSDIHTKELMFAHNKVKKRKTNSGVIKRNYRLRVYLFSKHKFVTCNARSLVPKGAVI